MYVGSVVADAMIMRNHKPILEGKDTHDGYFDIFLNLLKIYLFLISVVNLKLVLVFLKMQIHIESIGSDHE